MCSGCLESCSIFPNKILIIYECESHQIAASMQGYEYCFILGRMYLTDWKIGFSVLDVKSFGIQNNEHFIAPDSCTLD